MEHGWSLDVAPWQNLRKFTSDKDLKWKSTPFDKFYKDRMPTSSGVYIICVRPPSDIPVPQKFFSPIYVGKASESIRDRFMYHLSPQAMPKVKKARQVYKLWDNEPMFQFVEVNKKYVAELESILIDCFGPTSNDVPGIRLEIDYLENE